jgi:hypothetical protein
MKKLFIPLLGMISVMSITTTTAQNVGVTDKSGGITPTNLLQVHKAGTPAGSATIIQMTTDGTGVVATDGVQMGIDSVSNGFITNQETGKNIRVGVSGTSNTTFENDGTVVFNGAATVFDDVRGILISRTEATSPTMSPFGGSTTIYEWQFDKNLSTKYLCCDIQLPHGYKEGSKIYPHIHWTPSDAGTGNVVWKVDYEWVNVGGSYNLTTTTTLSATVAANGAWASGIADLAPTGIDGTGKTISSILVCRIYRDGNDAADTYDNSAAIIGFDIHVEENTLGSRTVTTK